MEGGVGQKYDFSIFEITVAANSGGIIDIFNLTAQTGIPIVVEYVKVTANVNQANGVPMRYVVRSSAGSGGASTNSSIAPEPPSGSAATEVISYNITTVGGLGRYLQPEIWQQLGVSEYNRIPGGTLITPGQAFGLMVPTGGITSSFVCSIAGTYYAMK